MKRLNTLHLRAIRDGIGSDLSEEEIRSLCAELVAARHMGNQVSSHLERWPHDESLSHIKPSHAAWRREREKSES